MEYGDEATRFIERNAHAITREAIEYAYTHHDEPPVHIDETSAITVVEGTDPSGRRFRITISAEQVILVVRPL